MTAVERPEHDVYVSRHGTCATCRTPIVEHASIADPDVRTWHHLGPPIPAHDGHQPEPEATNPE